MSHFIGGLLGGGFETLVSRITEGPGQYDLFPRLKEIVDSLMAHYGAYKNCKHRFAAKHLLGFPRTDAEQQKLNRRSLKLLSDIHRLNLFFQKKLPFFEELGNKLLDTPDMPLKSLPEELSTEQRLKQSVRAVQERELSAEQIRNHVLKRLSPQEHNNVLLKYLNTLLPKKLVSKMSMRNSFTREFAQLPNLARTFLQAVEGPHDLAVIIPEKIPRRSKQAHKETKRQFFGKVNALQKFLKECEQRFPDKLKKSNTLDLLWEKVLESLYHKLGKLSTPTGVQNVPIFKLATPRFETGKKDENYPRPTGSSEVGLMISNFFRSDNALGAKIELVKTWIWIMILSNTKKTSQGGRDHTLPISEVQTVILDALRGTITMDRALKRIGELFGPDVISINNIYEFCLGAKSPAADTIDEMTKRLETLYRRYDERIPQSVTRETLEQTIDCFAGASAFSLYYQLVKGIVGTRHIRTFHAIMSPLPQDALTNREALRNAIYEGIDWTSVPFLKKIVIHLALPFFRILTNLVFHRIMNFSRSISISMVDGSLSERMPVILDKLRQVFETVKWGMVSWDEKEGVSALAKEVYLAAYFKQKPVPGIRASAITFPSHSRDTEVHSRFATALLEHYGLYFAFRQAFVDAKDSIDKALQTLPKPVRFLLNVVLFVPILAMIITRVLLVAPVEILCNFILKWIVHFFARRTSYITDFIKGRIEALSSRHRVSLLTPLEGSLLRTLRDTVSSIAEMERNAESALPVSESRYMEKMLALMSSMHMATQYFSCHSPDDVHQKKQMLTSSGWIDLLEKLLAPGLRPSIALSMGRLLESFIKPEGLQNHLATLFSSMTGSILHADKENTTEEEKVENLACMCKELKRIIYNKEVDNPAIKLQQIATFLNSHTAPLPDDVDKTALLAIGDVNLVEAGLQRWMQLHHIEDMVEPRELIEKYLRILLLYSIRLGTRKFEKPHAMDRELTLQIEKFKDLLLASGGLIPRLEQLISVLPDAGSETFEQNIRGAMELILNFRETARAELMEMQSNNRIGMPTWQVHAANVSALLERLTFIEKQFRILIDTLPEVRELFALLEQKIGTGIASERPAIREMVNRLEQKEEFMGIPSYVYDLNIIKKRIPWMDASSSDEEEMHLTVEDDHIVGQAPPTPSPTPPEAHGYEDAVIRTATEGALETLGLLREQAASQLENIYFHHIDMLDSLFELPIARFIQNRILEALISEGEELLETLQAPSTLRLFAGVLMESFTKK